MFVVPGMTMIEFGTYYYLYKELINPNITPRKFLKKMVRHSPNMVWYYVSDVSHGPLGLCIVRLSPKLTRLTPTQIGLIGPLNLPPPPIQCEIKRDFEGKASARLVYLGVLPFARRKGLGTNMLKFVVSRCPADRFIAYVPERNLPMQLLLRKCGWLATGIKRRRGDEYIRFVYENVNRPQALAVGRYVLNPDSKPLSTEGASNGQGPEG